MVASTGNISYKSGINYPSCLPQIIKVGAVANDAAGTRIANFTNLGIPANFIGPILLAPGGSGFEFNPNGTLLYNVTNVKSADPASTTATRDTNGTSMAAPHVAGLYAATKAAVPGISVNDATAWIAGSGSIPVQVSLPGSGDTQTYRRIRVPAL